MRFAGAASSLTCLTFIAFAAITPAAQQEPQAQPVQVPTTIVPVRAIDPAGVVLPPESATINQTKFAFIAYGDTRGPADGRIIQPAHKDVIDLAIETIAARRRTAFPVRFVVQTGDAVLNGRFGEQWNVSFTPLVERLIQKGGVPYFFAVGNHDLGLRPMGDPDREARLLNTKAAMAKLWPPDGSSRRLAGYAAFAFGYGSFYFVVLDSNIAADPVQFEWVKSQLASLDRKRFRNVVAVFHHPVLTSGAHSGPPIERPSLALRELYQPLFRSHHVRMTIAGHDHLYDHHIEHYDDAAGTHRMDHIVSGGGGAPIYSYKAEQDFAAYAAMAPAETRVRVEHPVRPARETSGNPHHFVLFEVDGDRIWLQLFATVAAPFRPYGQQRIELDELDHPF